MSMTNVALLALFFAAASGLPREAGIRYEVVKPELTCEVVLSTCEATASGGVSNSIPRTFHNNGAPLALVYETREKV